MAQIPIRCRNHIQPEKALAQSDCQGLAAPLAIQDQRSVAICWGLRDCHGPLVSIRPPGRRRVLVGCDPSGGSISRSLAAALVLPVV